MGHKAFVFDTQTFHKMIEPIMAASVNNPETARQFICEHLDLLQSPYTGETLDEDWENESDKLTLQVYFDILLTACYDAEDDMGLGELWDAVNEVIGEMDILETPQIAVLGKEVVVGNITVDPGMMGLGIVESDEVPIVLDKLLENRENAENTEPENLLYEAEADEWMEAYDALCNLYEEVKHQGKGLLFTF